MRVFAALRKEDVAKIRQAERTAKQALDDPEEFAKRMHGNATFADLYQNDKRRFDLLASK